MQYLVISIYYCMYAKHHIDVFKFYFLILKNYSSICTVAYGDMFLLITLFRRYCAMMVPFRCSRIHSISFHIISLLLHLFVHSNLLYTLIG